MAENMVSAEHKAPGGDRCFPSDDSNVFAFQSNDLDPPPRRRGWDRVPKSPFGPRHQGRKLWKRYDTRSWKAAICAIGDDTPAPKADEDETSIPEKTIKRLRLKQSPSRCAKGEGGRSLAPYITTLRDDAPGTPKRKPAKRKSLKYRRANYEISKQVSVNESGTETLLAVQVHVRRNSTLELKKSSPLKNTDDTFSPKKAGMKSTEIFSPRLTQQPLHSHQHSPSPSPRANFDVQDVEAGVEGIILQCGEINNLEEAPRSPNLDSEVPINSNVLIDEPTNVPDEANEVSCTHTLDNGEEVVHLLQSAKLESCDSEIGTEKKTHSSSTLVNPLSSEEASRRDGVSKDISKDTSLCRQLEDVVLSNPEEGTEAIDGTENRDRALSASPSSPSPSAFSPCALGTAKTKTDATGLVDIDTEGFGNLDTDQPGDGNSEPSGHHRSIGVKSSTTVPDSCLLPDELVQPEPSRLEVDQDPITVLRCDANGLWKDCDVRSKKHDTPVTAGTVLVTDDSLTKDGKSAPGGDASHRPSDDVAPRLDRLEAPAQVVGSSRITRSGSRFSEETNMLRDFLSRAQARKAAKDFSMSAQAPGAGSPRRSPRKPLAEINNDSPSPDKGRPVSKRPGTPPGQAKLAMGNVDELDELDKLDGPVPETSSYRRSTRTRLFTPARAAPGAPSLIPVRRGEGGDKVRLQPSVAQELATVTRSNTRRNRGQSKPPKLALQSLPVEPVAATGVVSAKGEGSGKSVGWDATLVYYQATSGTAAGKERRSRKRTGPAEAPGGGAGLRKETAEAATANARRGGKGRGRNKG